MVMSADFIRRFLTTPESNTWKSAFLSEWAKATLLVNGSWTDALAASLDVSIFFLCWLATWT